MDAPRLGLLNELPPTPPYTPEHEIKQPSDFLNGRVRAPETPPPSPRDGADPLADPSLAQWTAFGLDRTLSALLRDATALAHERVMKAPIVDMLITGRIPRELHTRYLMMLHHVYTTLEEALSMHAAEPTLASIANAAILSRTDALSVDIAFFSGNVDWNHSATAEAIASWPELAEYTRRLTSLSSGIAVDVPPDTVNRPPPPSPYLLLAHAYVRYMGDLSGGQHIARAVAQAYGIQPDDLAFYRFGTPDDPSATATASEKKQIKAWFRAGLDKAGQQLTSLQKAELMQEANYVFELNVRLFASFARLLDRPIAPVDMPSAQPASHSKASTYAPIRSDATALLLPAPVATVPRIDSHGALRVVVVLLAIFWAFWRY